MAFKAKFQTSPFVFTGNPIILESEGYPTDKLKGGKFSVLYEGEKVYEGRFFPPLNIDISEITDAASDFLPEATNFREDPVILLERIELTGTNINRLIRVEVDYNAQDSEIFEMIGIPGGIPRQQFKTYALAGSDIFDSRFCGPGCNFFFTSRTSEWRIEIKETELFPLYFISIGQNYVFRCPSGKEITRDLPRGIYGLDLNALRKEFIQLHGLLPNVFDIETEEGGFCCQIVITHSEPSKERYRLKFRNSFGVFEIMEITGQLTESSSLQEPEENSYRKFDPVTRRFSTLRNRLDATRSFSITTPIDKVQGEFLTDLLSSEEIYLLDVLKVPARVNVTSEDFTRRRRPETPESISLKLELTDPDHFFGDEIAGINDSRKQKVHSKQFNNKFN